MAHECRDRGVRPGRHHPGAQGGERQDNWLWASLDAGAAAAGAVAAGAVAATAT
jgi:hypothetical protein